MKPAIHITILLAGLSLGLSGVALVAAASLRTNNNGVTSIQTQNDGGRAMDVTMTLHDMGGAKTAVLSHPVALSNKNNVVSGSQVVVANSQVAMAQNDRFRISGGKMTISGVTTAEDSEDSSE